MRLVLRILLFPLLFPLPVSAATYYVAKTGDDAHPCARAQSPATAKQTIQAGVRCAFPGDTVEVAEGTYVETVSSWRSGEKGRPITVKAKPGHRVIWRGGGTGPKGGAVVIAQQSFIRIEGFIFEGTTARSTIHVRNHPRKKATAPVQGIEIVGNHFLSNGSRTNDTRVIYFQSAGHKTFHHTAAPNVISGNTFRGNYGRGISLLASSDTVVSKNTGTDGKGSSRKRDGVYAARFLQIGGEDKAGNNSERNVVEQNTIRDFTVQPYVGSARNEIQAIKLDANADWNVIRENLIFNLDAERHKGSEGIFIESRCDDNVVSGNIVYNVGESCYRDGSRTTTVTRRNRWINNIGYNCECGLALSNAQGATVRNNIFAQNRVAQVYITTTSVANGGHLFSRNLYHKTNHSKLNTWNGPASGCGEATQDFPEWTAASHDTNSLVADPQFANPPADFRLRATSPAREAGVTGTDRSAPQRGENSR